MNNPVSIKKAGQDQPQTVRQAIERHVRFAENLQIETEVFHSRDRARGLVGYARENGCTQIFLNRDEKPRRRWFHSPDLDLIVWFDEANTRRAFSRRAAS